MYSHTVSPPRNAFHVRTGELLWQFNTGSGIHSNPVTYSVNGKQYVAVASGWGAGWKAIPRKCTVHSGATRSSLRAPVWMPLWGQLGLTDSRRTNMEAGAKLFSTWSTGC